MPVVKAAQSGIHRSAIVMDLSDIETQAKRVLADARAQAAHLLDQARARAETEAAALKAAATEQGGKEGFAAGLIEGQKRGFDEAMGAVKPGVESLIQAWEQTLERFQKSLPVHHAESQQELVRLAIGIAAHVTHQEALWNRGVVEETVKAALQMVTDGRHVALAINPDEVGYLEQYLPGLLKKIRTVEEIELQPDATVTPGGCMVRFAGGQIDARLETQIERIAAELLVEQKDEHAADGAAEPKS
jgi:flagellar biosynthesis/type III secretory pathway protein FliH